MFTLALHALLNNGSPEKILIQETKPSLYVYSQTFEVPGTRERRTRRGLIARGHLEDYSSGIVFRHEQTLSGPKADRLELLRHTRAHTGQLFMLYDDPARRVDEIISCVADGADITRLVMNLELSIDYGALMTRK